VSWVAHDLEPYVFQRKLWKGAGISFVAVLLGSWGPDMFTKWLAYGTSIAGWKVQANDPTRFHRGWPGVGFTHSLTFGVVLAAVVYACTRSGPWAIGLLLGVWFHVLSDTGDTVGVMLFFPWTHHFAFGAWQYAATLGRYQDGAAYYSGPGFMWDAFWIVALLLSFRVMRRSYFHERIAPRDGFWAWSGRLMPEHALVALYRGAIFFGLCRFVTWMLWAHVLHHHAFDPTWGGPHWALQARS
jgi:membrane-bound metal-dependent hydrolase YbcI (DUF457 family)